MNTDQRIAIAEWMGYVTTRRSEEWHGPVWEGKSPEGLATWRLPDPANSADDDYAVLEAMRGQDRKMFQKFYWALREAAKNRDYANPGARRFAMAATQYQIGDYARAALKVIHE